LQSRGKVRADRRMEDGGERSYQSQYT